MVRIANKTSKISFKIVNIFILFFLTNFSLFALSNQYIPGDAPEFNQSISGNNSDFFDNSKNTKKKIPSSFIPNSNLPDLYYGSQIKQISFSQEVPSTKVSNSETVLDIDKTEVFKKNYNKGSTSFSFSYLKDNYSVTDPKNVFNSTFNKGSSSSSRSGYLLFSFDRNLFKYNNLLRWGYDFGFSYSHGNGVFKGGTESQTDIKFWVIPLDLYLKFDINLFTTTKLSIFAGPSIVGIWQSRSDMDEGESVGNAYQSRRQLGYGYIAGAKFLVSLTRWLPSLSMEMFKTYEITNVYFALEGRMQNYGNFLDPMDIKGSSIGIGFTFDFL